jgi:hypothetical protein
MEKLLGVPALAVSLFSFMTALAFGQECPQGTYRMITGNGVKCVPYANGGPSKPGPGRSQSTITGPSGSGGDGTRGAPASSAR